MSWVIHCGDALTMLRTLPEASVRCCVTSPPYFGLRDYGTATWKGGDPACDHKGMPLASSSSSLAGYTSETVKMRTFTMPMGQTCRKCSATRIDAQIGLEREPAAFVGRLVEVFEEVRRVLTGDGTLWLNMGDSYAGSWGTQSREHAGKHAPNISALSANQVKAAHRREARTGSIPAGSSLKPKDLIGIPWMVAFALRDAGWYLRSDIIWHKPNPMPESVTDRPTKAHEYVFLLSKSARYFYDADAIRQPYVRLWDETNGGSLRETPDEEAARAGLVGQAKAHRGAYPLPKQREAYTGHATKDYDSANAQDPSDTKRRVLESMEKYAGSNRRSVWSITTQPFAGAHFATFPEELPELCIKAGSAVGDIVLDPFAGAATTGLVADRLGRDFIGIELNPSYREIGRERLNAVAPLFPNEVGVSA